MLYFSLSVNLNNNISDVQTSDARARETVIALILGFLINDEWKQIFIICNLLR